MSESVTSVMWVNTRQTKGLPSVCAFTEHLGKQMGLTHKAQSSHEECISPAGRLKTNSQRVHGQA